MDLLTLIIGGLAVWRLSNLLVKQIGPLAVFARFRALLASKQKRPGGLYDMFSCLSCMSMTIGAVTSLALAGSVLEFILYTLSFSAIATLTDALIAKNSNSL